MDEVDESSNPPPPKRRKYMRHMTETRREKKPNACHVEGCNRPKWSKNNNARWCRKHRKEMLTEQNRAAKRAQRIRDM